ncbi:MAG: family protein phosphatase [Solirubrobacteraceae bacterium]|nr:family protein phosphatase [Solirubrobacteraceae bacterium]
MSDRATIGFAGCGGCGTPHAPGDRFCEQCGASLESTSAPADRDACSSCGAAPGARDEDGYCTICGLRGRARGDRDELDLSAAAAVSDQGLVHRRNEDAFHLEVVAERHGAAVVCDGISSATAGDLAAQGAARAAGRALALAAGDPSSDAIVATLGAIRAAGDAVELVPWSPEVDRAMPSCTLVSALWRDGELVIGWIGDSRAYWLTEDGCRQLTTDDSWAAEQVAAGTITADEAARDSRFHAITHWVGADAPARPPQVVTLRPEHPGRLMLCSDGLWNYAPRAADLAALVDALPAAAGPAAVARSLTETALARGGRDNITVAVIDIEPEDPARRRHQ